MHDVSRAPRCSTWSSSTGSARGIVDARPGHRRDRVASRPTPWSSATGGYGNVFYLSTNAKGCNVTAIWRAYKRGAAFANPCFTQIHPTCIPVSGDYQSKLTLMSESLRNDGRVWVPKQKGDSAAARTRFPKTSATTTSSGSIPSFGNLVAARHRLARRQGSVRRRPRRRPGRAAASTSTSRDAIKRLGARHDRERYGNLFEMYERITGRESVRGADAHLSRRPLHDGRAVGGLQPDEHDSRAVRDRRGELLRSRREPARRERADAGAGRRLLHHAVHDRRLPRPTQARARSTTDHAAVRSGGSATSRAHVKRLLSTSRASARSTRSTASSAR